MIRFKNFKTVNGYPILFAGKCNKRKKLGEMFWGHNDPEHANHHDEHAAKAWKTGPEGWKKVKEFETKLQNHYQFIDPAHHKAIKEYTGSTGRTINTRILRQHGIHSQKDGEMETNWHHYSWEKDAVQHTEKHLPKVLAQHKTPEDMHVFSGLGFTPEHQIHNRGGVFHLPAYTSTSISRNAAHGFGRSDEKSNHIYNNQTFQQMPSRHYHAIKKRYNDAQEFFGRMGNYAKMRDVDMGKATAAEHGSEFEQHYNTYNKYKRFLPQHGQYTHTLRIHVPAGSHGAYIAHHSDFPEEKEFLLHKNAMVKLHHQPEVDHAAKRVIWHAKLIHDGIKPTRHFDEQ